MTADLITTPTAAVCLRKNSGLWEEMEALSLKQLCWLLLMKSLCTWQNAKSQSPGEQEQLWLQVKKRRQPAELRYEISHRGKSVISDKLDSIRLFVSFSPWMSDTCISSCCNCRRLINLQRASTCPATGDRYESFAFTETERKNKNSALSIYGFTKTALINANRIIWAHRAEIQCHYSRPRVVGRSLKAITSNWALGCRRCNWKAHGV